MPLDEIIDRFRKLQSVDPNVFPAFSEQAIYKVIEEFFKELEQRTNDTPEQQIQFFADTQIHQRLLEWIGVLNSMIVENVDLRLLALTLYQILVQLAMYIACIQNEDIDAAKIPLAEVFKQMQAHITSWARLITAGQFSQEHVAVVKQIGNDMNVELARITSNGEDAVKRVYAAILRRLIRMIETI